MKQTEGIFFFFFAVPYLFVNFFSLVSFVLEHFPYSELGKLHSCSKSSFLLLNLSLLYKVVRSGRMIQVLLLFCLLHTVFLILQEYFIDELYVLPSFSLNYIISRYFVFIFVCFVSLDVKLISGSSFHVPVSFMIKSSINLPPNSFIFIWWCYLDPLFHSSFLCLFVMFWFSSTISSTFLIGNSSLKIDFLSSTIWV